MHSSGMLTLTYIVLAAVGCGVVALTIVMGSVFDGHGMFDHHGGIDTGFHFPFLSPTALAALAGAIGAIGLIALYGFHASDATSLLVALPAGFVFTYAVTYVAWRVLRGSTGTTTVRPEDLAGVMAEVITPIPAGGVGEAAAVVHGERFTASAREVDGLDVPRGAIVTVVRFAGATLYVRAELAGVRREPAASRSH
jgi:membrane protein implicated in regulation of membrane protease activity